VERRRQRQMCIRDSFYTCTFYWNEFIYKLFKRGTKRQQVKRKYESKLLSEIVLLKRLQTW
jgi:hypothetical protein